MSPILPLTIVHALVPAREGGLEAVVLDLAVGLRSFGQRSVVLGVQEYGAVEAPVLSRVAARGVEVIRVFVHPKAYLEEYRAIRAAFLRLQPDVVHTHGYRADIIAGFAAQGIGVPWVSTAHGFTGGDRKNKFFEWLQIQSYRRAEAVVSVSSPIHNRLHAAGIGPDTIHSLPNAWAPKAVFTSAAARSRLGVTGSQPVIGWVGRLTREKGADVFLEALALLPHRNWHASILGDGRERPALEVRATRLGISKQVSWHGLLPGAARLYCAFDCWVLSSRTEGTPIALFEAMAARVPAVVTAVGGVPDVVSNEEACVVEPGNPAALAAAIAGVLAHPAEAAARAEAARAKLEKEFALEPWLHAHVALYQSLSKRARRGHNA